MSRLNLKQQMVLSLLFTCLGFGAHAQTFMGVEQSKQLKIQRYQTPKSPIQTMSPESFKSTVDTLSQQNQQAATEALNKKMLPPPASVPTLPNTQGSLPNTNVMNNPGASPSAPVTSPPPTSVYPSAPNTIQGAPAPSAEPQPYTGFRSPNNANRPSNNNSGNAPKRSGWNIQY